MHLAMTCLQFTKYFRYPFEESNDVAIWKTTLVILHYDSGHAC